jgi:hypothetical protein
MCTRSASGHFILKMDIAKFSDKGKRGKSCPCTAPSTLCLTKNNAMKKYGRMEV